MAKSSVVRNQGEGKAYWMLGGLYEQKVGSDETGGAMTLMEMTIPPGNGPPPHTHPCDETVYVLAGTLQYNIEGEKFEGRPGSVFRIPAGTVENFEPTGNTNLRVLVAYTPGGIENFFAEAGEVAQKRELPPQSATPPDLERIAAIGSKHGMDIQPPPS
jgi:quercetin dioxygenase-like cupin family protein